MPDSFMKINSLQKKINASQAQKARKTLLIKRFHDFQLSPLRDPLLLKWPILEEGIDNITSIILGRVNGVTRFCDASDALTH